MEDTDCLQLNTKGLCLLCLNPSPADDNNHQDDNQFQSFKPVIEFLKINIFNSDYFSSSILESADDMGNLDVKIYLCEECATKTGEITRLYQDLEKLKLQLEKCVAGLYKSMKTGQEDDAKVEEYKKRMRTRKVGDLFNASVVESLRKETMEKCSEKLTTAVFNDVTSGNENDDLEEDSETCMSIQISDICSVKPINEHLELENQDVLVNESVVKENDASPKSPLQEGESPDCLEMDDIHIHMEVEVGSIKAELPNNREPYVRNELETSLLPRSSKQLEGSKQKTTHIDKSQRSRCPDYRKQFLSVSKLNQHHKQHNLSKHKLKAVKVTQVIKAPTVKGAQQFNCKHCKKTFDRPDRLKHHGKTVHVWQTFQGYLPPGTTSAQFEEGLDSILDRCPINEDHMRRYSCGYCVGGNFHKCELKTHLISQHFKEILLVLKNMEFDEEDREDPVFECSICNKKCSSELSLKNHLKYHSGKAPKPKCEYCPKSYTNTYNLQRHLLTIHPLQILGKYLPLGTTCGELRKAIQCMHSDGPDGKKHYRCVCPLCSIRFSRCDKFRLHVFEKHFDKVMKTLHSTQEQRQLYKTEIHFK